MTQNPFSLAELMEDGDPYPKFAAVRSETPIVKTDFGWIVLGHDEVNHILRSRDTRTGYLADNFRKVLPEGAARDEMTHRINFLDAPDHNRVRKLSVQAFTPKRMQDLAPFIQNLCQKLVDEFDGEKPIDLMQGFAHTVPTLVISELLGVPTKDRGQLGLWSSDVAVLLSLGLAPVSETVFEKALQSAEEMHAYLRALVDERRAAPQDDLLSALLAAEEDGDQLSEKELLSLAATLYSAGHRTTRDLFSNGLAVLLSEPEKRAAYQNGGLAIEHVVEEILRFATPTFYIGRRLAKDISLGGVTIPKGETAILFLAAANRDPRAYHDPEKFLPERWAEDPKPLPHVSFAFGPHFCLGAHLARLEVQIMLEVLFATYPTLAFSREPVWQQHGIYRSVDSLEIDLGKRS